MVKIALLGTGAMGTRIGQNFLTAQHSIVVYNRNADKLLPLVDMGAETAPTPKAAAAQADIVISMVTDDNASQNIWLTPDTGAIHGLQAGAIALESSTLTVEWTKTLASKIEQRGAELLDAPVLGSRPQAEAKKLIYLVGGSAERFQQIEPLLLTTAARALHLGSVGQGMTMKLAANALFGMQVAAMAEILGFLSKQGMKPEEAMSCLAKLPIISPAAQAAAGLMMANQHAPLFPIDLVEKDLRYAIDAAQKVNASVPTVTAIQAIYRRAIAQGHGADNITGVAQLYWSGSERG